MLHAINQDLHDWRSRDVRSHYEYTVEIDGLEGKIVNGTTKILVPIPANSNGKLVPTPAQKEPGLSQKLFHKYITHTPAEMPYFENTSESFDNRKIDGNWTSYIAETEDGYMLCFQTNASVLENIFLWDRIVVDQVNGLDPLNESNPILYPARNFSDAENFSNVEKNYFEGMGVYSYNPAYKYDSFIHTSNNLDEIELDFSFSMDVSERVTGGSNKYNIISSTSTNSSGKTKIDVIVNEPRLSRKPSY